MDVRDNQLCVLLLGALLVATPRAVSIQCTQCQIIYLLLLCVYTSNISILSYMKFDSIELTIRCYFLVEFVICEVITCVTELFDRPRVNLY